MHSMNVDNEFARYQACYGIVNEENSNQTNGLVADIGLSCYLSTHNFNILLQTNWSKDCANIWPSIKGNHADLIGQM